MDQRTEDELRVTAYHEAGHAVGYWLSECSFDYVTIIPEQHEKGSGPGHLKNWGAEIPKQGWVNVAAVIRALAGGVAEKTFTLRKVDFDPEFPGDLEHALWEIGGGAFGNVFGEDFKPRWVRKLLPAIHGLTVDLLWGNWLAVETIAEALLARKTLKESEVYEILQEAELSEKILKFRAEAYKGFQSEQVEDFNGPKKGEG